MPCVAPCGVPVLCVAPCEVPVPCVAPCGVPVLCVAPCEIPVPCVAPCGVPVLCVAPCGTHVLNVMFLVCKDFLIPFLGGTGTDSTNPPAAKGLKSLMNAGSYGKLGTNSHPAGIFVFNFRWHSVNPTEQFCVVVG